jgi:hypothetical protein
MWLNFFKRNTSSLGQVIDKLQVLRGHMWLNFFKRNTSITWSGYCQIAGFEGSYVAKLL